MDANSGSLAVLGCMHGCTIETRLFKELEEASEIHIILAHVQLLVVVVIDRVSTLYILSNIKGDNQNKHSLIGIALHMTRGGLKPRHRLGQYACKCASESSFH